MKDVIGIVSLAFIASVGCSNAQAPTTTPAPQAGAAAGATATLRPTKGNTASGTAVFKPEGGKVALEVTLASTPAGVHAVHIHEKGDCSAEDGSSAGAHWNPTAADHGHWGTAPFHLGDIGNVTVGEDGKGTIRLSTDLWSLGGGGGNDILGKAVIVHAAADDFTTQPTGAAGGRIACGVIEKH